MGINEKQIIKQQVTKGKPVFYSNVLFNIKYIKTRF